MALEAQNNPFTSVLMVGAADPEALPDADPAAGSYRLVVDDAGTLFVLDDAGNAVDVAGTAGAVATDAIWDAAGDLVQGTGANTGGKLSAGTAGNYLRSAGAAAANTWAFPPGHEFDYAQYTSAVSITASTEATANTIVTGNAVTYDGSTIVMIEYFAPYFALPTLADMIICLYDGSTALGGLALLSQEGYATGTARHAVRTARRYTPSAASHTFSVRAYTSVSGASAGGGAGGTGAHPPGFIRITKV